MTRYTTWLTINRQCNLACYWCYQGKLLSSVEKMTLDLARELIDLSIGMGAQKIILLGGEPTIHPDFLEIVRYCRKVETGLLTNGIAFANKKFLARTLDAGLSAISTSLKGTGDCDYASNCGARNVFAKVMQSIENVEASGARHQVSVTVSRSVIDDWPAMLQVIRNCGARQFTFSFERPVVKASDVTFDDRMLPGKIIPFIEQTMYPSLLETGVDFDLNVTFPQCHFSPGFLDMAHAAGHAVAGCQLLMNNGIIFDPNGRVLPCNHLYDHPLGEFGKDFMTLSDMREWRDTPDIKKFYDLASAPPGARCGSCASWGSCGAGCRIFWLYKGSKVLLPVKSKSNRERSKHGHSAHDQAV